MVCRDESGAWHAHAHAGWSQGTSTMQGRRGLQQPLEHSHDLSGCLICLAAHYEHSERERHVRELHAPPNVPTPHRMCHMVQAVRATGCAGNSRSGLASSTTRMRPWVIARTSGESCVGGIQVHCSETRRRRDSLIGSRRPECAMGHTDERSQASWGITRVVDSSGL